MLPVRLIFRQGMPRRRGRCGLRRVRPRRVYLRRLTAAGRLASDGFEEPQRLPESGVEPDLRAPAQGAPGGGGVYGAAQLLAGLGRSVLGREVPAGGVAQDLVELVDAGLYGG